MKLITMIGAVVGMLLELPAAAQTVQVPCTEFVQITGQKIVCDNGRSGFHKKIGGL